MIGLVIRHVTLREAGDLLFALALESDELEGS